VSTANRDVTYPSAEHFMMAAKALLFGDAGTADRVRQAPHPGRRRHWAARCAGSMSSVGPSADDDRAVSPENWPGLNLLGFALMEVRGQLRSRPSQSPSRRL
jgi:predicted NAD-dependent protein-ADP-ribosyltransferase YbiA (DUF1768 family)